MVILLQTKDGGTVARVEDPAIQMMIANGRPPDVLLWGLRYFALGNVVANMTFYREVYVMAVTNAQTWG